MSGNVQGVPATPSGHSAEPEPSSTVSAVPVSVPNAMLPILIDRLPQFSSHWSMDHIERWFGWFFVLLDAAIAETRQAATPRAMLAGDIGWQPERTGA